MTYIYIYKVRGVPCTLHLVKKSHFFFRNGSPPVHLRPLGACVMNLQANPPALQTLYDIIRNAAVPPQCSSPSRIQQRSTTPQQQYPCVFSFRLPLRGLWGCLIPTEARELKGERNVMPPFAARLSVWSLACLSSTTTAASCCFR